MKRPAGAAAALALLALFLALAACTPSSRAIPRLYDGVEARGPRVAPEAYAEYIEGARLEAAGDWPGARAAYRRALEEDSASPELWARHASAECRLGRAPVDAVFADAVRVDAGYGPTWTEMARCHALRGNTDAALETALRGAALSPNDEETTEVVVRVLQQRGATDRAARWITAWRLAHPDEVSPLVRDASEAWLVDVDRALAAGDLVRAREYSARARISAGELALRAAALGRPREASQQASFALRADPADGDAWVARLVAADLNHDEPAFAAALVARAAEGDPPSPAAVRALSELIERRVGEQAARELREAAAGYGPPADAAEPVPGALPDGTDPGEGDKALPAGATSAPRAR